MPEHEHAPEDNPADALSFLEALPVPPQLAEAFGYRGQARYVGFHWEPMGDESFFDDGRSSGTANWYPFLQYQRHLAVAPHLEPYNLGHSDVDAEHMIIIDRQTDLIHVAPIGAARAFLKRQWPPPPELSPYELEEMRRAIEETLTRGWREVKVDHDAVLRAMEEQRQQTARMMDYLNRWPDV